MKRLQALSFGVVFMAAAAFAQTGADPESTSPDEEFTPWVGDGAPAAPAPKAQLDPKKKPAVPSAPGAASDATAPAASAPSDAAQAQPADPSAAPTSNGEDWAELPASSAPPATSAPPPPAASDSPPLSAPPVPATPGPGAGPTPPPGPIVIKKPTPQEFNRVSIYGAPTLGQFKRGLGAYLGFPLLGLKAGIGLMDRFDVGLGFDSFYGVMNEPRAWMKFQLLDDKNWSASVQLEAGMAFFTQRPEAEGKGARWLTGRRNYNIEPGVIFSYRGDSVQSARLFMDVRYHLGLDTQPFARDPLGGVPPPIVLGHNVPVRLGAEMPFSPSTSFLFIFGFDVHGREEDSRFMPVVSVGLVTGI